MIRPPLKRFEQIQGLRHPCMESIYGLSPNSETMRSLRSYQKTQSTTRGTTRYNVDLGTITALQCKDVGGCSDGSKYDTRTLVRCNREDVTAKGSDSRKQAVQWTRNSGLTPSTPFREVLAQEQCGYCRRSGTRGYGLPVA